MQREVELIRTGVALSRMPHVVHLRLSGEDAFALLDRVRPAELFLRDGQVLQSLLLLPDGRPRCDLLVGRDDEDFFLFAEGDDAVGLTEWLRAQAPPGARVELTPLDETYEAMSLHGPYAWELLG